ncbi:ABC transporter permease [Candidatus Woesearchaeota archaeon]|nr:ABC transporter permease [Candidatus Woesearchaeota archaeon]
MLQDYLSLAVGSLRKRFLRTSLTMIGIFIGIAAVVAFISLGQGMRDAINQQFSSVGTDKIIVQGASAGFGPPGQTNAGKVDEHDLKLLRNTLGVKRAAGRILRSATLEYADQVTAVFAVSLPELPDDRNLVIEANNLKMKQGRMLASGEKGRVVLGNNYLKEGKYTKPLRLGSKILLNGKSYEVIGFLDKIGAGRDDAVILNENDLRQLVDMPKEFSVLVAQVQEGEPIDAVVDRLERAMRRDRNQKEGFEDFTVESSGQVIASINVIVGVVQAVFVGIALISLLVGGIGIMNTMYTSVLEQTRAIGIMKALGARNQDIMALFLFESGLLGIAGGVIGIVLGVGMSKAVELLGRGFVGDVLQASFPWYLLVGALLFSCGIGMLAGLLPAMRASKMQPVEALRYG